MTEQEAKEHLEARLECMTREMAVGFDERCDKNCDECDLLYAQGTIGEIKETYRMGIKALEKQIPKKMNKLEYAVDVYGDCPCCNHVYQLTREDIGYVKYCFECGQKLDWGNEDDRD